MEMLKKVLETVLTIISILIDYTFMMLEAPYILVMNILLAYEKCSVVYVWVPICGVCSMWINDWTNKIEYSIDGHILIRKLFKK